MTIIYPMTVYADIIFDDIFEYHGMREINVTLEECVMKAKKIMREYKFKSALIVNAETGEIYVEMEND